MKYIYLFITIILIIIIIIKITQIQSNKELKIKWLKFLIFGMRSKIVSLMVALGIIII